MDYLTYSKLEEAMLVYSVGVNLEMTEIVTKSENLIVSLFTNLVNTLRYDDYGVKELEYEK